MGKVGISNELIQLGQNHGWPNKGIGARGRGSAGGGVPFGALPYGMNDAQAIYNRMGGGGPGKPFDRRDIRQEPMVRHATKHARAIDRMESSMAELTAIGYFAALQGSSPNPPGLGPYDFHLESPNNSDTILNKKVLARREVFDNDAADVSEFGVPNYG
jgi:hypothetical protein